AVAASGTVSPPLSPVGPIDGASVAASPEVPPSPGFPPLLCEQATAIDVARSTPHHRSSVIIIHTFPTERSPSDLLAIQRPGAQVPQRGHDDPVIEGDGEAHA